MDKPGLGEIVHCAPHFFTALENVSRSQWLMFVSTLGEEVTAEKCIGCFLKKVATFPAVGEVGGIYPLDSF